MTCLCGCGKNPKLGNKFIRGHNSIGSNNYKRKTILCKGGLKRNHKGYSLSLSPDHPHANCTGYVLTHRLVYEESRNCCLLKWVDIHHKDGNKSNNVWSNLIPIPHGEHTRLECTIDMSDRICCLCGSNKTKIDKRCNRPKWAKSSDGFMCNKCANRKWYREKYGILRPRILLAF